MKAHTGDMRALLLCLMVVAGPAGAFPTVQPDWVHVVTSDDGADFQWIVSRTKFASGSITVWMVLDQRKVAGSRRVGGPSVVYGMDQISIDCAKEEMRPLASYRFDSRGSVVSSDTLLRQAIAPPPGTAGDYLIKMVCDTARDVAASAPPR